MDHPIVFTWGLVLPIAYGLLALRIFALSLKSTSDARSAEDLPPTWRAMVLLGLVVASVLWPLTFLWSLVGFVRSGKWG